ncbi:F-box/kelch-repeat protein At3g23880-like [Quercus robur]|uniref:F-box/kelch-repeat protein At3g23880-like n=1 Tax=Quercus robur TaxID=38942 RepID=UPI0021614C3B|nr:F-box/kelch-repeat protein At3g23880-like [Quercus robur]XP_050245368.1 F-box/kelch-repeat protein At3g23880-like [Quercus robur]
MMMATTPTQFDDLPHEIALNILIRLPVKTLLQFRCVSTYYNSIITSSNFITKHFKLNLVKSLLSNKNNNNNDYLLCKARSHREQDTLCTIVCNISDHTLTEVSRWRVPVSNATIVGICKGLFCLVFQQFTVHAFNADSRPIDGTWVFDIYLWNPNIGKFKIIPSTDDSFEPFGYGFGYYHIQNNDFDFKVLRYGRFFRQNRLDFQVYTLSTDSWKQLSSFNGSRGPITRIDLPPYLFFNGALHFIAYSCGHKFILCFDLHNDNFREILLPQDYSNGLFFKLEQLAVLEGSLAVIAFDSHVLIEKCHIWVMGVYGDVDSWTPNIVDLKDVKNFFGCMSSGELVIRKSSPHKLILFDPKSPDEKSIGIGDLAPEIYTANLMESLVFLNERN